MQMTAYFIVILVNLKLETISSRNGIDKGGNVHIHAAS